RGSRARSRLDEGPLLWYKYRWQTTRIGGPFSATQLRPDARSGWTGRKGMQTQPTTLKEHDMTILTTHEQQEIDRANTSGLQPVVFVHGLWLLSSSWDRWRALFEEQGYTTLAPGWPDDPDTVEEAKHDPEVFAHKRIKQITDHYIDAIG